VHLLGVAPNSGTESQELIRESNFTVTPNAASICLLIQDQIYSIPSLFPLFQIDGNKSFSPLEENGSLLEKPKHGIVLVGDKLTRQAEN
jgi:hypothetical protein